MGNCALSLSFTCLGSPGSSMDWCVSLWVDVSSQSSPQLTSRLSSASDHYWMTLPQLQWSVSLGFAPPWLGSPIFCINKAQDASSKLVRIGIEVLLLFYYVIVYYFGIKKIWRQDLWCNALHVWMVIAKCLWGIICVIYHCFCWLIVGLEGESYLMLG